MLTIDLCTSVTTTDRPCIVLIYCYSVANTFISFLHFPDQGLFINYHISSLKILDLPGNLAHQDLSVRLILKKNYIAVILVSHRNTVGV